MSTSNTKIITSDKTMSTENNKIIKGNEIGGLFSKPQSVTITVKSEKYGNLEFECRPMNNQVYAEMGSAMNTSNVKTENLEGLSALKVFGEIYYPAIKVVFPYCCVNPKIINGVSSDPKVISIDNVPMEICMDLFAQLMDASGLSEKADLERKN